MFPKNTEIFLRVPDLKPLSFQKVGALAGVYSSSGPSVTVVFLNMGIGGGGYQVPGPLALRVGAGGYTPGGETCAATPFRMRHTDAALTPNSSPISRVVMPSASI